MIKYSLLGLSALALVACNEGGVSQNTAKDAYNGGMEMAEADFAPAPPPQAMRKSAPTQPTDQSGADPAGVYLAYRYGYGLVMPSSSVKATTDKHIQICRDAGPKLCQVTGSNTQSYTETDIRANLSLRAEPDWLVSFISGMKADVAEVDGKIENENTSVEDLTRSILDTDARLKAKRTLRTRLENLLETRNAKLPDLLTLERELARVQSEIESATANLKALKARVSMSVVNINYSSERVAVSRSSVSPIGAALKDFVSIISESLAGVIRVIAALLPWLIFVVMPGVFLFRWFWRRRKTKKTA